MDYPSDESLDKISKWDFKDAKGCFEYMRSLWAYADIGYWQEEMVDGDPYLQVTYEKPRQRYFLYTAGWSGNEDIIMAFKQNTILWSITWVQSRRGGHYIFEVKNQNG